MEEELFGDCYPKWSRETTLSLAAFQKYLSKANTPLCTRKFRLLQIVSQIITLSDKQRR